MIIAKTFGITNVSHGGCEGRQTSLVVAPILAERGLLRVLDTHWPTCSVDYYEVPAVFASDRGRHGLWHSLPPSLIAVSFSTTKPATDTGTILSGHVISSKEGRIACIDACCAEVQEWRQNQVVQELRSNRSKGPRTCCPSDGLAFRLEQSRTLTVSQTECSLMIRTGGYRKCCLEDLPNGDLPEGERCYGASSNVGQVGANYLLSVQDTLQADVFAPSTQEKLAK